MIHIFFSASAAGTFRQLLGTRGIAEEVADISEELDFGPISHGDLANREPWLNRYVPMDFGEHDWLANDEERFSKRVASDPDRLIWLAPASATEQAGLYWYLSTFGGHGTSLAIAAYPFGGTWNGGSPLQLSQLSVDTMGQLYDECPREAWNPMHFPEDRWSKLVAENALIRVVDEGQLRSAPDDHFDNFLFASCPTAWTKWHRVVGDAMGDIWNTGQSAGVYLLLWRLRFLIEDDQIACDGDPPTFGGSVSSAVQIRRVG